MPAAREKQMAHVPQGVIEGAGNFRIKCESVWEIATLSERASLKASATVPLEPWHVVRGYLARDYFVGLDRATSAALVAALISSAAASMWAPTSRAGIPL